MRTACIFNIMAQSAYIIKKPRKFSRAIVAIISVAVLITACLLFYTFNVYPILKTLTEEEVKSTTTVLMNDAVKSVIDKNISYLKTQGFITRVGSNKNGYWKVLENEK